MQVSSKKYMYLNCGNCKKEDKRNYYYKLNNFQLFKRNDASTKINVKKDLVVYHDICNNKINVGEIIPKALAGQSGLGVQRAVAHRVRHPRRIGRNGNYVNKINAKHYSYERYLAKKKGCVINNMLKKDINLYKKNYEKHQIYNPCTWNSSYKNCLKSNKCATF